MLVSLLSAAVRCGLEAKVIIPGGGALEAELRKHFDGRVSIVRQSVPDLRHGSKSFRDVLKLVLFSIRTAFRHFAVARQCQLIYVNAPRYFLGASLLAIISRRDCILHLHLDYGGIQGWLVLICARLPRTRMMVANSHFIARRLCRRFPSLSGRLRVVENCLSASFRNLPFRPPLRSGNERLRIAVVGVVRPEKGQDLAIQLALADARVEIHIIGRVGEGAEVWLSDLRARAPDSVTFHGPVNDLPVVMNALGIHVNLVPSTWEEPFGLVAIEGMACSCLTIVANKGALPDIAARTGAVVFEDLDSLKAVVSDLVTLPLAQFEAEARNQYNAVMCAYGNGRFEGEMAEIYRSQGRLAQHT